MDNLFLYLLVNETAGSGNCKKKLPEIQKEIRKRKVPFELINIRGMLLN